MPKAAPARSGEEHPPGVRPPEPEGAYRRGRPGKPRGRLQSAVHREDERLLVARSGASKAPLAFFFGKCPSISQNLTPRHPTDPTWWRAPVLSGATALPALYTLRTSTTRPQRHSSQKQKSWHDQDSMASMAFRAMAATSGSSVRLSISRSSSTRSILLHATSALISLYDGT